MICLLQPETLTQGIANVHPIWLHVSVILTFWTILIATCFVKARPDVYHIDTTNVLFIVSGAFVGLDKIIKQRVAKGVGGLVLQR